MRFYITQRMGWKHESDDRTAIKKPTEPKPCTCIARCSHCICGNPTAPKKPAR